MNWTFKHLYPDYETFQAKVIDIIQHEYPNNSWCQYDKMLTKWESIYYFFYRNFNWRSLRYSTMQTNNLIINEFIEQLPEFYLKQKLFLENNLKSFNEIKNLGEISSVVKKLNQSQKQKNTSNTESNNFVSPQGFINSIEDMPISESQKGESKSNLDSENDLNLETEDNLWKVDVLTKLQELANSKFKYLLKGLISNFDKYFRVANILEVADKELYENLKKIFIDSQNVNYIFDDNKQTISCDLKNIEDLKSELNNKINLDFKNTNLNDIVSKNTGNILLVTKNNQLFVKGSETGQYFGDSHTTIIDSKNVIKAIGLQTNDQQIIASDDINDKLNIVQKNEENIAKNKININKNTSNIDLVTINSNNNTKSINFINTTMVNKSKLKDIISPLESNTITLDIYGFLYSKPVISNPEWTFLCSEKDFTFKKLFNNSYGWSPNKAIVFKPGNIYLIFYQLSNGEIFTKPLITDKLIWTVKKDRTIRLFSVLVEKSINFIYLYISENNLFSRIDSNYVNQRLINITDKFVIYYQENVLEEPLIENENQNNEINLNKTKWLD